MYPIRSLLIIEPTERTDLAQIFHAKIAEDDAKDRKEKRNSKMGTVFVPFALHRGFA